MVDSDHAAAEAVARARAALADLTETPRSYAPRDVCLQALAEAVLALGADVRRIADRLDELQTKPEEEE